MNEWIKDFIKLNPRNQLLTILLTLIFLLCEVIRHYENKIIELDLSHKIEMNQKEAIIREKDNQYKIMVDEYSNFMEKQIMIGYGFKKEIDSLKTIKK